MSEPTIEHVSAIARVAAGIVRPGTTREAIMRILTSGDPAIHRALIASLLDRGALTVEDQWCATPTYGASRKRVVGPYFDETTWRPCGLGPCAANDGHEGTCDEASGWVDEDPGPDLADLRRRMESVERSRRPEPLHRNPGGGWCGPGNRCRDCA